MADLFDDGFDGGFDISRDKLALNLIPSFLGKTVADDLLKQLIAETPWQQPKIKVYGKWHKTPRLLSFYAEKNLAYQYSKTLHKPHIWTPNLLALKAQIELAASAKYNSVLLNYYRDGQDAMGWHSDDEAELGKQPNIASLSLGAARDMHFKAKAGGDLIKLNLASGDLLMMKGQTQAAWKHQIPRRAKCVSPRINLTFRWVFS